MEGFSATHPADIVAHAFARQYYAILQHSPGLVYRFYQDTSKLGRTEVDGGMGLTTTMEAINQKITSYGSLKVEVKSVDAQLSFNGGVIVVISGELINKDESRRMFVQTFFLAPQEHGYFVLNDIFRFVGESHSEEPNVFESNDVVVPQSCPEQASSQVLTHGIPEKTAEVYGVDVLCPSDNEKAFAIQKEETIPAVVNEAPVEPQAVIKAVLKVEEVPNKYHEERASNKHADDVLNKKQEELPKKSDKGVLTKSDEVAPNKSVEGEPKKTYASIVMVSNTQAPPSESFPKIQQPVAVATPPVSAVDAPLLGDNVVEDVNLEDEERTVTGERHSIYLRNLPTNVTYDMIVETFSKFGSIKFGTIQIRKHKGFCFGFLDFEVRQAVEDAIEASPIRIDGHKVGVEEKKSTGYRAGTRDRFSYSGRGAYRHDRGRGRGIYGGRWYDRGVVNRNDYGSRDNSRGGCQNRSGHGYARNETGRAYHSGGRMQMDAAARVY